MNAEHPGDPDRRRDGIASKIYRVFAWLNAAVALRLGFSGPRLLRLRHFVNHPRDANQTAIRKLCVGVYLGGDTVLCRVLGRYKMFVDTRDVGLSSHLMIDGYWEMWLTELIIKTVGKGMVVADVGANLGYFTVLMADLVGPDGQVHAFEPNAPINRRLRKSVTVNGYDDRVMVHDAPLGSETGRIVTLTVPVDEPKNAHITPADPASGAATLTTERMDSIEPLKHADVIKIDAEGAELDIWNGMAGIFAERRKPLTIFLEFASIRYADPQAFLDDIIAKGFSLSELTLNRGVQSRTAAQILAAPPRIDQMLVLRR